MKKRLNKSIKEQYKILCISCKNYTNHEVLASVDLMDSEEWDEFTFSWCEKYQVIKCLGCNSISFRSEKSNSEDYNPATGQSEVCEQIFPRRDKYTINAKKIMNLPSNINHLYNETIDSYNNNILILCAAGVRGLVEGLCIDKNIVDGEIDIEKNDRLKQSKRVKNLKGKINGLYEKGVLTKENANVLHTHRFLGNEAIHELTTPSKEELYLSINIIEMILKSVYEVPAKAKKLNRVRKKKNDI